MTFTFITLKAFRKTKQKISSCAPADTTLALTLGVRAALHYSPRSTIFI
jgi:hypothetical protein